MIAGGGKSERRRATDANAAASNQNRPLTHDRPLIA
jgi:hypothetical protein